jgi:2-hydroxychromene-2-carboxylate isomerase
LLFESPQKLEKEDFVKYAHEAGVEPASFNACLDDPPADKVRTDSELAASLKLTGTPVFLVGEVTGDSLHVSEVLAGARPIGDFVVALDKLLKKTSGV